MKGLIVRRPLDSPARRHGRVLAPAFLWLLMLALSLAAAAPAAAALLNLSWNAPTSNEDGSSLQDLAGYRVYYGYYSTHAPDPPCNGSRIDVGKVTNYQLTGLTQGSAYYVQVTAVDTAGNESACSGEASGVAAPQTATLTLAKYGAGTGTVTSVPSGISCGADCSEAYGLNATVSLTAAPASGSAFAGWSGACSGTGSCSVVMSQSRSVTATFNAATASTATLSVTKTGAGAGTVTSSPAGITCGTDCSESYSTAASVTLTAAPAAGSSFAGWSGACTGTGTCTVSMSQARTATATFNLANLAGTNGLVAAYSLNAASGGTVPDASGNSWSGTVSGAWATAGRYGSGLAFDGVNDQVTTRFAANLSRWTVSVWVRSGAAPAAKRSTGPVHREKNFQINWNHESAAFRGAAALRVNGAWHAASFGSLAANTWYHLTATYDGETLRAYRNGILVSSNYNPSGTPDSESATMKLGRHATAAQHFWGTVDEVRVYNRALSLAEIQAVMTTPLP